MILLLGTTLLMACHKDKAAPSHEDLRQAAEEYYGYLVAGDVEQFARAIHDYDSLSVEYRLQLRDMFAQYLANEQKQRGGLLSAKAVKDTQLGENEAEVFLNVTFGDSTCEQVSMPMVRTKQGWKMK